jgi:hypothetical protein
MGHANDLLSRIRNGSDESIIEALDELLPRWIPTGERLPDELDTVILTDGEWVTFGSWSEAYNRWYVEEDAEANGPAERERFTHWMPLPEPPERT